MANSVLDDLLERLRRVQADVDREVERLLAEGRARFNYTLKGGRVVFDQQVRRLHHAQSTRAWIYLKRAPLSFILSAPLIYGLIIRWCSWMSRSRCFSRFVSTLWHPAGATGGLSDHRPTSSRLSQHHRAAQLHLLWICQSIDRIRARGCRSHRTVLVSNPPCPAHPRPACAHPPIRRLWRRHWVCSALACAAPGLEWRGAACASPSRARIDPIAGLGIGLRLRSPSPRSLASWMVVDQDAAPTRPPVP